MAYHIEVVAADNNMCGEAPVWDPSRSRILWVDIDSSLIFEMDVRGGTTRIIGQDLSVSGIVVNRDGRLVLCGVTGLHLWRRQGDYRTLVSEHGGEKLAFNDMVADSVGRIYAGTLYWVGDRMEKAGRLFLIEADGSIRVVDEGIELSNGLGFSPDNRTLYYSDSSARRIYAYEVNPITGDATKRQVFARVSEDEGIPDGLTVDAEGFVWSAQWYGSQVVRYDPDGKVERRIPMPVRQVSSLAFGGSDLNDLYVTTAGVSWQSNCAPPGYDFGAPNMGGSLYRIRLDVRGKPDYVANMVSMA
ncbi:MAG: SMP-30/gluconolactonase/LRE family protein [Phycisphaerae bacterium]|nr:SMP-30/gluconolactonase/LRE family protein [Phycisphaerae bacterium]